jgi:type IV secretory pathway VirB6-like protein
MKKKLLYSIFAIISLTSCGEGCKAPDEDGLWEQLNTIAVLPINIDVLDAGAEGLFLKKGVTEAKAKENLWVTPRTSDLENGIIKVGMDIKIDVDINSTINLKGYHDNVELATEKIGSDGGVYYQQDNITSMTMDKDGKIENLSKSDMKKFDNLAPNEDGIYFKAKKNGVIPLKFARTKFKPGQKVSLTVASKTYTEGVSSSSGTVRENSALVESVGCDINGTTECDQYIPLRNGHGLYVYILPQEKYIINSAKYSNPDQWQCHLGPSGSNAKYSTADPKSQEIIEDNDKLSYLPETLNEINGILLPLLCLPVKTFWFSGYDFYKNADEDSKDYNYHQYDAQSLFVRVPDDTTSDTALTQVLYSVRQADYPNYMEKAGEIFTADEKKIEIIYSRLGPFAGMHATLQEKLTPLYGNAYLDGEWPIVGPLKDRKWWRQDGITATYVCDGAICPPNLAYLKYNINDENFKKAVKILKQDEFGIRMHNIALLSDENFARCTDNWKIPKWMLVNSNINDTSFFMSGFSAVSGSFIGKQNENITPTAVKASYDIDNVHARYGGIIRNAVYNQTCPKNEEGDIECQTGGAMVFTPEFRTIYNKQMIFIKNLNHDPVNTFNKTCKIKVESSGTTSEQEIFANEPYGNMKDLIEVSSGDSPSDYFEDTVMFRNLVGSGTIAPQWHMIKKVFNKGELVKINAENESFYIGGTLNHEDKSNKHEPDFDPPGTNKFWGCNPLDATMYNTNAAYIAFYVILIGVAIPPPIGLGPTVAFTANYLPQLSIIQSQFEDPKMEPEENVKKQCGTAVAFRVVPVASAICKSGYRLKCTNERINSYVASINSKITNNDYNIKMSCLEETGIDSTALGQCIKTSYNIKTPNIADLNSEEFQKYNSQTAMLNRIESINKTSQWTLSENIQEDHCGLCIAEEDVYTNQGINYIKKDVKDILAPAINSSRSCSGSIQGPDGKKRNYKWITNYFYVNTRINQLVKDFINSKYLELYDNDISKYNPSQSADIENNMQYAWELALYRDFKKCTVNIKKIYAAYNKEFVELNKDKDLIEIMYKSVESQAEKVCTELINRMITDQSYSSNGSTFFRYSFKANKFYTSCGDKKDTIDTSGGNYSLTSYQKSDSLYNGHAELTPILGAGNGIIEFNIPTTIRDIDGREIAFERADLGFVFAPSQNKDNPAKMLTDISEQYSIFRTNQIRDETRGYTISIGDGVPTKKGKHMYIYFQPLKEDGEPDEDYNPNEIFKNADHLSISKNSMIYSFAALDTNQDGKIKMSSPRTGKIWYAILDIFESDIQGENIYNDTDGKMIIFENENDSVVDDLGSNYIGFNTGYYTVSTRIQTDKKSHFSNLINDTMLGSAVKIPSTTSIFNKLIIRPIKTILFGEWDSDEKTYKWKDGLVYKIATLFTGSALIHSLYYVLVTLSVFIIGFEIMLGQKKITINDAKKYGVKFALITTFASPGAWDLYGKFFVKGSIDIVEGLSALVAGNFAASAFYVYEPENFVDVGFGPINDIFEYMFRTETIERILAVIFSSLFGIIPAAVSLAAFGMFMTTAIQAMIMYVFILVAMALYLAAGPIVFLALFRDETSQYFTNWWKSIAALMAQQVFLFIALAMFGTIYLNILKGFLDFIICWEPILVIPYLNITIFSFWRRADVAPAHVLQLMGESAPLVKGTQSINLASALILLLLTMMMMKFCNQAASFGASLFGGSSFGNEAAKVSQKLMSYVKSGMSALTSRAGNLLKKKV